MYSSEKDLVSEQCNKLYSEYYKNNEISKETSSHWRKYGEFQKVKKTIDGYYLNGIGFGDFKKDNILNLLKNIPTTFYISRLLKNCDNNIVNKANLVAKKSSRLFSYDLARQALIINQLSNSIPRIETRSFCIIGDGYGSLGCLIKHLFPKSKVISINLGRTLLFDLYYSQKVFPELEHLLIRDKKNILSNDFNYIEAEKYKDINFHADIFINVCSMQEMNYEDIKYYFEKMRSQISETWFYCCNRISKVLPDGSIINFNNYGWSKKDLIIFDELCPWHQKAPRNTPPFISKFDGPHQHRLIKVFLKK